MPKQVRFVNVEKAATPYEVAIRGLGKVSGDTLNNVPTGTHDAYVQDADGKRSMPRKVTVRDPADIQDKNVNWEYIPEFSLPAGMIAVYGWGAPRWLDEPNGTWPLTRGWTHVDSGFDGDDVPETQRAIFYTMGGTQYHQSVDAVVAGGEPTAVNIKIAQVWQVSAGPSGTTATYIDATGANRSDNVQADTDVYIYVDENNTPTVSDGTSSVTRIDFAQRLHNIGAVTDAVIESVGRQFYAQHVFKYNNDTVTWDKRPEVLLWDEEVFGDWHTEAERNRFNSHMIKGFLQEAASQSKSLKVLYYGRSFTAWGHGYYSDENVGDYQNGIFPYLSNNQKSQFDQAVSAITDVYPALGTYSLYFDAAGGYLKVPLPSTHSRYEKQGGNYVFDIDGKRKYNTTAIQEVIRNQSVSWRLVPVDSNQNGFYQGATAAYGYPNNIVPEMRWGVEQMYQLVTKFITGLLSGRKIEFDDADIYGTTENWKVKPMPVLRDECEPSSPSMEIFIRPLSDYQMEFQMLFALVICETMYMWTTYDYVNHPNNPFNANLRQATNKGSGVYRTGTSPVTGTEFQDFGQFDAATWAMARLAELHAEHDVFAAGNKKLIFYTPSATNEEITAAGRVKDNKVYVLLSEPRLDYDETMTVVLRNKKNAYSQVITLKGNEVFQEVFILPAGTYEPSDIYLEYETIYGATRKVSGDLRSHFVNT